LSSELKAMEPTKLDCPACKTSCGLPAIIATDCFIHRFSLQLRHTKKTAATLIREIDTTAGSRDCLKFLTGKTLTASEEGP
jgi:hypothetical protein